MIHGSLVYTLDELDVAAATLYNLLGKTRVIGFTGSLGAGKTTLIQELLKQCGVDAIIQSPTFTYVSIYTAHDETRYYHFDLYRLKSQQEFIDAGFADYIYEPGSVALIEWPEIIINLLTRDVCYVAIDHISTEQRRLRYECLP